ncbi:TPA: inovirus Gp2 family protein [Klebsiella oxytoca]|uniref:inovirus Gp2 family protein n=1 Tax=Klebsiella oxytoca TaxID=571 RepID=UPI00115C377D|nr:inovirus Gp2 family protein [Klebsiella oxytoca]HCH7903379.1 inovirus Gp2 family protein [Klebsiella oxytoca]
MLNHLCLDRSQAPFNEKYLQAIINTMDNALMQHHRTLAVRVDLRLPEYRDIGDSISCTPNITRGLLSRFIRSAQSKIDAFQKRQAKQSKRINPCKLRYLWVKEIADASKPHFHVVLFVNKDIFRGLGDFLHTGDNLGSFIQDAWLSALGLEDYPEYRQLVHFPANPLYVLDINAANFQQACNALTFRISYFAKEHTKVYDAYERSIGYSQC